MTEVVYVSNVRLERRKGPLRLAYLPGEEKPVTFSVHGGIAKHYGVDEKKLGESHAATIDYVVAATAGWMLGTFGGALEARKIDASDGRLIASVRGEVESEEGVLVIRRIHIAFRLRAPHEVRETVERVHGLFPNNCPLFRTLHNAIEITSSYTIEGEGAEEWILQCMFRAFSRKNLERIKHVWGAGRIWGGSHVQHWLQHPLVQERINIKVSGTAQMNRFEYFLDRYLRGSMPVEHALTLGSGVGELERGLCQYGFARFHEGLDLSDEAVRIASQKAESEGFGHIRYRNEDLNTVTLDRRSYDVIFGVSSVHHIHNLEHLFQQVQQALKPGGYFFLDEFIGPSRFQWTDAQIRVINDQLQQIPKDLRRLVSDHTKFKERVVRKSVSYMIVADPSEAVRSSEIVPLLEDYFSILEIKGYGGAILHELLYDIAGNFCEENAGSLDHLRKLFEVEDRLTACQTVGDDFAVIIATREKHRRTNT